ncbi:nickel transporter [Streptomyces winkii]|uniref:nickel transporter n=1 Tax=Streptomyces winkii TaxID=3051178 RepID=UPI0028D456C6|nr:nickel transporter [Streptomyces sp. DSM 40971]
MILALLIGIGAAPGAYAHPLGNFSLNHHDGLRLSSGHIEDTAVVDSAEIPTAQLREKADTDDDGDVSRAEAATRARQRCSRLAEATRVTVDGRRGEWRVRSSRLTYGKGTAGLPVARLTCRLRTDADLSRAAAITFASGADPRRTGWKEITATAGDRVRLTASSVPERSASTGLRRYPSGAADDPPNQTKASLRTRPGDHRSSPGTDEAAPGAGPSVAGASLFPSLERELTALTTSRDLTVPVGLLGVLLTVLLGAGHAALPGHAKLAVAACLARHTGGVRAAVAVGATVTATHTTGVLIVGLALTLSGGLLGDQLLGWLGTISGLLIAGIGTWLVITAVRALNTGRPPTSRHHRHGHSPHDHAHAHSHNHSHSHSHSHDHPRPGEEEHRRTRRLPSLLGVGLAGGLVPSPSALVVLLGAISLSRTFFGVLLVLGYGLGMAGTLTAAGLLLSGGGNRLTTLAERRLPAWSRYTRYGTLLTALAVLTVGLALTLRSLPPL